MLPRRILGGLMPRRYVFVKWVKWGEVITAAEIPSRGVSVYIKEPQIHVRRGNVRIRRVHNERYRDGFERRAGEIGVSLGGSGITDEALVQVKALSQIRNLSLYDTQVTDDGLKHVRSMTQLRSLCILKGVVTDSGLRHVAHLKSLEELQIEDVGITDVGIEHIRDMPHLQDIFIPDNNLTEEAVEKLKERLPSNCRVIF